MTDLMAGRVQYTFDGPTALGQVKGGKAKLLAVTSSKRRSAFPDVPTVAESGVAGFDVVTWFGLWAPAATPSPSSTT